VRFPEFFDGHESLDGQNENQKQLGDIGDQFVIQLCGEIGDRTSDEQHYGYQGGYV
jgi:hypothetical protein